MAWDFFKNLGKNKEKKTDKTKPLGSSGTQIYTGYIEEDYLGILNENETQYKIFDQMSRSDGTISMCLKSYEETFLSSKWSFSVKEEFAEKENKAQKQIDFMNEVFPEIYFRNFLNDAISFAKHGFVVFDIFYQPMEVNKKLYLAPRLKHLSARTIRQWVTDESGMLQGIIQESTNDDGFNGFIPIDRLFYYAINKRGNNFKGISLIRPCYGSYMRKVDDYKRIAIGNYFLSLPFMKIYSETKVPLKKADLERFQKVLAGRYKENKFTSHIVFPEGFKCEEVKSEFDPTKLYDCIDKEDVQMIRAFCANFLMIGGQSGSGSFALGDALAKFFTKGIANSIKGLKAVIDKEIIEKTIKLNFAGQECMIEASHSEVDSEGGVNFATAIQTLVNARTISPDEKLEAFVRNKYELPKKFVDESVDPSNDPYKKPVEPSNNDPKDPINDPEDSEDESEDNDDKKANDKLKKAEKDPKKKQKLTLNKDNIFKVQAERSFKRIDMLISDVEQHYTEQLYPLLNKKVKKIISYFNKNKDSQALYDLKLSDFDVPSTKIVKDITLVSEDSFDKETKDLSNVFDLSKTDNQSLYSYEFFQKRPSTKAMKRRIKNIVQADVFDFTNKLDVTLLNTFYDAIETAEGSVAVTALLTAAGTKTIKSNLAKKASTVPQKTINNARNSVFNSREEEIESYTYYNPSPVTAICQYLNGKTVTENEKNNYQPPLHFNCKTVVFVNLKEFKNNPKTEKLKPNKTQKAAIQI